MTCENDTNETQETDFVINQGASFEIILEFFDEDDAPVDVSAWTFEGQVRETTESAATLLTFSFAAGALSNEKKMRLTPMQTSGVVIPPPPKTGGAPPIRATLTALYDVKATQPDTFVSRELQGYALISGQVTKP